MSDSLDTLRVNTRWDGIPDLGDAYRLLCTDPECSLSCANLRKGRFAVTAVHGTERHSQVLTKKDMLFATLIFLNSLSGAEMETFCRMYNKSVNNHALTLDNFDSP